MVGKERFARGRAVATKMENVADGLRQAGREHDAIEQVIDVHGCENALAAIGQNQRPRLGHFHGLTEPGSRPRTVHIARPHDGAVDLTRGMGGQHHVLTGTLGHAVAILVADHHIAAFIGVTLIVPAQRRNRRKLYEASGTTGNGGIQAVAHALHRNVAIKLPVRCQRHNRSRVDEQLAALGMLGPGLWPCQIARHDVVVRVGEQVHAAHFRPERLVARYQGAADETAGPGDKYGARNVGGLPCCTAGHHGVRHKNVL
ncbi:hypothetical protein D9M71_142060 [compost metagenome]